MGKLLQDFTNPGAPSLDRANHFDARQPENLIPPVRTKFRRAQSAEPIIAATKIGDLYIVKTPHKNRKEHPFRPALLWAVYKDRDGRITAADFLPCSTRGKHLKYLLASLHYIGNDGRPSNISTSTLFTLSNTSITKGGSIGSITKGGSIGRRIDRLQNLLPDLLLRRSFTLHTNKSTQFVKEPGLDLSGTVREGVWIERMHPQNIRNGTDAPDVRSPTEPFARRAMTLPGDLTPDVVDYIALWMHWYMKKLHKEGLHQSARCPEVGSFPHGWPGWDEDGHRRTRFFMDWTRMSPTTEVPRRDLNNP